MSERRTSTEEHGRWEKLQEEERGLAEKETRRKCFYAILIKGIPKFALPLTET